MGNISSNDIDQKRIAEISAEINQQFSKDFLISFQNNIIENIKGNYINTSLDNYKSYNTTKSITYDLVQYTDQICDLKVGYLQKMGGNVKNWKRRYFVAANQSNNYDIIYYEDNTRANEKGR